MFSEINLNPKEEPVKIVSVPNPCFKKPVPVLAAGYGLKAAKLARTSPSPVVITTFPKDTK